MISKIHILVGNSDEIDERFFAALSYKTIVPTTALKLCLLAKEKGYQKVCLQGLLFCEDKWKNQPHYSSFRVSRVITMMDTNEKGEHSKELETLLHQTINEHRSGLHILDEEEKRKLYQRMWNHAVTLFGKEAKEQLEECLVWFERCISLLQIEENSEKAKCFRILTRTHLKLSNVDRALDCILTAQSLEPSSTMTQFLFSKTLLVKGISDEELTESLKSLVKLAKASKESHYIDVIAFEAMNAKKHGAAKFGFQSLLNYHLGQESRGERESLEEGYIGQILRALLKMETLVEDVSEKRNGILLCLKQTVEAVDSLGIEKVFTGGRDSQEYRWLSFVGWNESISVSNDVKKDVSLSSVASSFFETCYRLFSYLDPKQNEILILQQKCLLMASMHLIENDSVFVDKDKLKISLQFIEACREITLLLDPVYSFNAKPLQPDQERQEEQKMEVIEETRKLSTNDVLNFLWFLKFKACVHLGYPKNALLDILTNEEPLDKENIFEPSSQQYAKQNLLSRMARVCLSHKERHLEVALVAIKRAIESCVLYKDWDLKTKLVREKITVKEKLGEELYEDFKSAAEEIKRKDYVYPPDEVEWLMCTAWNKGVALVNTEQLNEGEKWLSLAYTLTFHFNTKPNLTKDIASNYDKFMSKK